MVVGFTLILLFTPITKNRSLMKYCAADLLPPDPMGVVGEYLNMTCTLNRDHPVIAHQYNASHLYFNVSGHVVRKAPYVEIRDESTALLYYYPLKVSQHRSFVECALDTAMDTAYIDQQYLWVGCKFLLLFACALDTFMILVFCVFFVVLLPHDPNLTVGTHLKMSCQINLTHPVVEGMYDARNVYFELHGFKLNSTFTKVASNLSQAELSFPDVGIEYDQTYVRCLVDTGPHVDNHIFVGAQHILVGCEYLVLKYKVPGFILVKVLYFMVL